MITPPAGCLLSRSNSNLTLLHLPELYDENYATQATDTVYHAPDPIYHARKLRRDWTLHWQIGGGEQQTTRPIEMMAGLGAIGVRLFGQTKLRLKLERVVGSGLLGGWTKSGALVVYDQYIVLEGFRS